MCDVVVTARVVLTNLQESLVEDFCVHMHDTWAQDMLSSGWEFDSEYSEELQRHPNIVHFKHLSSEVRMWVCGRIVRPM